jgi:hypothetical protein
MLQFRRLAVHTQAYRSLHLASQGCLQPDQWAQSSASLTIFGYVKTLEGNLGGYPEYDSASRKLVGEANNPPQLNFLTVTTWVGDKLCCMGT